MADSLPTPSVHTQMWAALAGYDAQYGRRSLAEQRPELPRGHVERVEAVVGAARLGLAEVERLREAGDRLANRLAVRGTHWSKHDEAALAAWREVTRS